MTAATAYCTSSTAFHQHSLTSPRSQFSSVPRRTTLSPSTSFSSTTIISHIEEPTIVKTIKSDENNNDHQFENSAIASPDEILYIASDYDDDDDEDIDEGGSTLDDITQENFLAHIGLRSKNRKPIVRNLTKQPLTKRLAVPVCLLPLPKHIDRVRQALYIRLPGLKSLSITYDIEYFCSTDDSAKAQSLLPRSVVQTRALSTLNKSSKKHKLPRTEFISVAANTLRNHRSKTSVGKYVHSILQCHVILDRLEQSTIDQIMQNSAEDDDKCITISSTTDPLLGTTSPGTCPTLSVATDETTTTTTTRTTITTMTTEKTIVKRKSTTETVKPKRFKSVNNDCAITNNNDIKTDPTSSTYERICLKCFVCSKRNYIRLPTTDSDVLHTHWLEHDGDLSLNIYDSEIDSILTRVVEFFNIPKQYMLEGKVKTVFILDSKEIRSTSTTNSLSDDCIVID